MTRGEMWSKRREELLKKLENGEMDFDLDDIDLTADLPKPLPRDEAFKYYNKRLKKYWVEAGYYKQAQKLVALEWIRYWIERAYERGYEDASKDE